MSRVCGIRGATTADNNTREAILAATKQLLHQLVDANQIDPRNIATAIFSTTEDLNAEFPAAAAHETGWENVALLGTRELTVPGAPKRCIRVLILVNTDMKPREVQHVYLKGAASLKARWAM